MEEGWRRIGGWLEEPWGTLGSLWNYFGGALDIEMLKYSLETEIRASEVYSELLPLIEQNDDIYDSMEQIYLAELKSVEEMRLLVR